MKPRTVKGWVVVNGGGHPFVQTTCSTRRHAIDAYYESGVGLYREDFKRHGVKVVRCTITTEPKETT